MHRDIAARNCLGEHALTESSYILYFILYYSYDIQCTSQAPSCIQNLLVIVSFSFSVGTGLQVKIADFGMARSFTAEKEIYKVEGKAVLPIRWLAPESLLYGIFSTASDVW